MELEIATEPAQERRNALGYARIRSQIQTGDILLFQGVHWVSRLIRWICGSPYSHAVMAVWWDERLMVVQCAERGVEIVPASQVVRRYAGQVDWWQPTPAVRSQLDLPALVTAAFDELGKPFAFLQLFTLFARMIWNRRHTAPALTPSTPRYFCSQLLSRCYRRAGVTLVPHKHDADTSPGDLALSAQLAFRGVVNPHPAGVRMALPGLTIESPSR